MSGRSRTTVRNTPSPLPAVENRCGSRDGHTLFFRNVDGTEMWSAGVTLEPTFRASKPEHLFTGSFLNDFSRQQTYDLSPDGQFLMIEEIDGSAQSQAVIVLNWAEELKRLVPIE